MPTGRQAESLFSRSIFISLGFYWLVYSRG
jgi:hypothetical protein